jgi:drug/metabolite transporter (DMT)-like permease
MVVGAAGLLSAGLLGLAPLHAGARRVNLVGHQVHVLVPLLGLSVAAGAIAYLAGIVAARRLGPTLASFVGLTEVLFASVWASLLLGQDITVRQALGGLIVLVGIAVLRVDQRPNAVAEPAATPEPSLAAPAS